MEKEVGEEKGEGKQRAVGRAAKPLLGSKLGGNHRGRGFCRHWACHPLARAIFRNTGIPPRAVRSRVWGHKEQRPQAHMPAHCVTGQVTVAGPGPEHALRGGKWERGR